MTFPPHAAGIRFLPGWASTAPAFDSLARKLEAPCSGHAGVVLAGWSLGGIHALASVANRVRASAAPAHAPESVRGLILISSTARFCAAEGYPSGVPRSELRAMMIGLQRDRNATLRAFFSRSVMPDSLCAGELDQRLRDASGLSTEMLADGLRELDTLDMREILPAIPLPVLILHGERDAIIPVDAARYVKDHLPKATLHLHPGAGHELFRSQEVWMAERITDFLRGLG
jgi:pimeloyl-[acyl-carrier protein] methyl ester esterase